METNIKQKVRLNFTHNKMELITDNDCEIVHEDGKWFVVRKEKKYPKTYYECCKVLDIEYPTITKHENAYSASYYKNSLIVDFIQLLICRDAYWKIAEDWKPDWQEIEQTKFIISIVKGEIKLNEYSFEQKLLAFPTAEMRNAFYENFKDLIEQCKELL